LLDEASSSLDIRHKLQIFDLIKTINTKRNITVFYISHDINQIMEFCTSVIFLKGGNILYSGAVRDVVNEAVLNEIFDVSAVIAKSPDGTGFVKFKNKKRKRE
jgi:iron complex transport system ATP-binding protein